MKKWILLILVSLCVCPAFAQKGLGRLVNGGAKGLVNPAAVERSAFRASPFLQPIKITNLPSGSALNNTKLVWTGNTALGVTQQSLSARLLDGPSLHALVFPQQEQMWVPLALAQNESSSVYRGITLSNLAELKNVLTNGLEANRGFYSGQVFTTPSLRIALNYALPSKYDVFAAQKGEFKIPVLLNIRLTQQIEQLPSGTMGLSRIFYQNIPSSALTDVMVFLEMGGKPGWYKAELKDGDIGFSAVQSGQVQVDEDFFAVPVQTAPTDLPNGAQSPARNAFFAKPKETRVNAPGEEFRVLPDEQLRQAISNDDEMKLFIPESFKQEDRTLYRGLRLKNTAELKNILVNGMEINKTHHGVIYVSPNVSVALGYMFPHQTAQLLGTAEDEMLPVLIKIPVTERLLKENLPGKTQEDFGGRRVLYNDVPVDMISEVAVYVEKNGVRGWYKVIWENEQLVFMPVESKTISGWLAE